VLDLPGPPLKGGWKNNILFPARSGTDLQGRPGGVYLGYVPGDKAPTGRTRLVGLTLLTKTGGLVEASCLVTQYQKDRKLGGKERFTSVRSGEKTR